MLGRCPDAISAGEIGEHGYLACLEVEGVDEYDGRRMAQGAAVLKDHPTKLGAAARWHCVLPTDIDACSPKTHI